MESYADPEFFEMLNNLPFHAKKAADADFLTWRDEPFANGLHFKEVIPKHKVWSVRAGISYRALGIKQEDGSMYWFWIGTHAEYDNHLNKLGKVNSSNAPKPRD